MWVPCGFQQYAHDPPLHRLPTVNRRASDPTQRGCCPLHDSCVAKVSAQRLPVADSNALHTPPGVILVVPWGVRRYRWREFLHCVHATIADPHAALWPRGLPSLAHLCLGNCESGQKKAKYGKSLSHIWRRLVPEWVACKQCRNPLLG